MQTPGVYLDWAMTASFQTLSNSSFIYLTIRWCIVSIPKASCHTPPHVNMLTYLVPLNHHGTISKEFDNKRIRPVALLRHEERSSYTECPEVRLGRKIIIFFADWLSKPL
jgi:hypothetical protein